MDKKIGILSLVTVTNRTFGSVPLTPADFDALSAAISAKTGKKMSPSTLKRMWGYIKYDGTPTTSTLNTICEYNGITSWHDFLDSLDDTGIEETSDFLEDLVVNTADLDAGDVLSLDWGQGKGCVLECIGDSHFRVVDARNIKLLPEDKLRLQTVSVGLPFYAFDIQRGTKVIPAYIGARDTGIRVMRVNRAS